MGVIEQLRGDRSLPIFDPLPPSSCPRRYWMAPKRKLFPTFLSDWLLKIFHLKTKECVQSCLLKKALHRKSLGRPWLATGFPIHHDRFLSMFFFLHILYPIMHNWKKTWQISKWKWYLVWDIAYALLVTLHNLPWGAPQIILDRQNCQVVMCQLCTALPQTTTLFSIQVNRIGSCQFYKLRHPCT